jgi:hypothetical protein
MNENPFMKFYLKGILHGIAISCGLGLLASGITLIVLGM